jgi:hypothetical protein
MLAVDVGGGGGGRGGKINDSGGKKSAKTAEKVYGKPFKTFLKDLGFM